MQDFILNLFNTPKYKGSRLYLLPLYYTKNFIIKERVHIHLPTKP